MKIRKGFVSNSSSASFIVEVKGKKKDIFHEMYSNMEIFSTEECITRLEKSLEMIKKYQTPDENAPINKKESFDWEVEDLEKKIKKFQDYKEPDWLKISGTDIKKEEYARWKHERHKEEVVKASIEALHWYVSVVNNDYICFNSGGCIMFNGWENIRMHKELVELLGFFSFMGYEVKTRIEADG